ncbi:MAG: discoidin domain-containing protein [Ruminococcaceae bacterium]|nr:discoidin domain-containing protein [Oscillospiraceae bacterium]
MKKTLATLLVLAMVMSVCCAMFVSAGDPAAELKAELEALVGAKEGAAYDWNIDVSVDEAGVVTANAYLTGINGLGIAVIQDWLYYDAEKLTLLNGKDGSALDCITAAPGDNDDETWENMSVAQGDGCIMLAVMNSLEGDIDAVITDEDPLVFTLKFQLAEGETLAGMYILSDGMPIPGTDEYTEGYIADIDYNAYYGNGAYAIVNTHTHEYVPAEVVEPNLSKEGAVTYTCECGDSYTKALPAVKAQPDELVALPEGALTLDYAGYIHDAFFCILAGDNLTVNELTALGNNGAGKDMNYCNVIVVDADGVVTETWFTLGRPDGVKSDVVCPEGGYIIGFNGNKAGADALTKIEKGAKITLYNIDLEAIRGVEGHAAVTNAGFTYENPAVEPPVDPEEPVEEKHVINISHVNYYTWGAYNAMIITGEGVNCTNGVNVAYSCEWWIALKVDNVDGVYTVTAIEGSGVAKEMTASADGFIVYIYSNDADSWNAAAAVEVGDVMLECTIDWSTDVASETPVGIVAFGPAFEVDEPDVPVENTKVEINVNDNALLTDGNTGFTGGWGDVSGKVVLANNGNCAAAGMDVTLYYALGETKKIDGITVDLYHCADVMIGYPEGQATVLASVDGETWTEVGKFDLAAAEVALGKPGTVSNVFEFDAVEAAYVKVLLYAGSSTGVLGDTPADNKIFWEFISVAEVAVSEAPVENTKVEINVNDNALLTDGNTGFTGGWGDVSGKVVLANNGNCAAAGMDVTLYYALGETKKIDGITVDLYHCADVMIGYPEGQATVLVSVDGETWTEVGKFDLAAAEVALGKPGTVSNVFEFNAVEAAYVKVLLYAGSSTDVLGDTPADNKIFWEFISVAEVAVSEAPENLAAGKEWTGDTDIGSSYKGDITDGVIDPYGKYDTSIWYGFDQRPSGDQIATIIIDLGNVYTNLDQIRAHVWPAGASGIAVPQHYNFYISEDGENYTLVSSIAGVKSSPCWVGTDNTDVLTARYIKLEIVGTSSDTFWFIDELEVNSYDPKIVEVEPPVDPEKPKHYEDTLVKGENGNYTVDYPYGFTWDVDYENGTIEGEDVTICDSLDAYNNSNPKYAISLILEKQADGSYLAVQDAIVGNGSVPAITLGEGQIVLVVHSSASNPENEAYDNWLGKVVAMSVKTGDKFFVDTEAMTVTAVDPEAEVEPPVVEPSEPDDGPGDAGVLLFAVLGILALAGAAVVIKVRN